MPARIRAVRGAAMSDVLVHMVSGVVQLGTYEAGLIKLLAEGGEDLLFVTVDGSSAPPSPRVGDGSDVSSLMEKLTSSAERASQAIDDNISAARAVSISSRQRCARRQ